MNLNNERKRWTVRREGERAGEGRTRVQSRKQKLLHVLQLEGVQYWELIFSQMSWGSTGIYREHSGICNSWKPPPAHKKEMVLLQPEAWGQLGRGNSEPERVGSSSGRKLMMLSPLWDEDAELRGHSAQVPGLKSHEWGLSPKILLQTILNKTASWCWDVEPSLNPSLITHLSKCFHTGSIFQIGFIANQIFHGLCSNPWFYLLAITCFQEIRRNVILFVKKN